jgi:hypothetical protein
MSVPFSVTYNQSLGIVPSNGGPQTIYVSSVTPANATFSQVYPGLTNAYVSGESVTVVVTGTGRYRGTYTGTVYVFDGGQGPVVVIYAPSAVIALSNTGGALSWTVNFGVPAFTDGTNRTNTTPLQNYRIRVQQSGAQANSLSPATQTDQTLTVDAAAQLNSSFTVYPEAQYLVTIDARNTANTSYGATNTYSFTTGILTPKSMYAFPARLTMSTAPLLTQFSRIANPTVLITDGVLVRGMVTSVETDVVSVSLNSQATRGTRFTSNTLSAGGGPGTSFTNFTTIPSTSTFGSNTLTTTVVGDQYTENPGSDGYYGYASVKIRTDPLTVSDAKQQVLLTKSGGFTTSNAYYYDGTNDNPDVSAAVLSINSMNFPTQQPICGVPCFYAGQVVNQQCTVSGAANMGTYFQPRYPVQYVSSDGATGSAYGTSVDNDTSFDATVGTTYTRRLTVSFTVFNTVGQQPGQETELFGLVFDDPSYKEYSNTRTVNLCNGSTPVASQRVVTPATLSTLTSLAQFDDTQLLYTGEIQLADGVYSSYLKPNAYLDYTDNTLDPGVPGPDYTGLAAAGGARFATFAWSFPNLHIIRNQINITVSGLPTPDAGRNTSPMLFNGEPLQVHYRYHDPTNPTVATGNFGTVWIDGNSKTKPYVGTDGNCYNLSQTPFGLISWSGSNGTYTFAVAFPHGIPANASCLLYVRVGFNDLLMSNQDIGFSGITLNSS